MLPGVTLTDGQTLTGLNVVLQPIGSTQLSGTATVPVGFESVFGPSAELLVHPGPGPGFVLSFNTLGIDSADFVLAAPVLPGIPLQVRTFGINDAGAGYFVWQTVGSQDAGIIVSAPQPSQPESPADRVTLNQSGAVFSWSAVEGAGVYVLEILGAARGTAPAVVSVYTTQLRATLPDFSRLRLASEFGSTWVVASFATPSSVDQLVTDAGVDVLVQGDLVQTISAIGTVTLQ